MVDILQLEQCGVGMDVHAQLHGVSKANLQQMHAVCHHHGGAPYQFCIICGERSMEVFVAGVSHNITHKLFCAIFRIIRSSTTGTSFIAWAFF